MVAAPILDVTPRRVRRRRVCLSSIPLLQFLRRSLGRPLSKRLADKGRDLVAE
jgi:hypothetical protein